MTNLKRTMRRYKLIEAHQELVSKGNYYSARMIFDFLRTGSIHLYFDDASWECEKILENCGFKIAIESRTGLASCYERWNKK